VLNVHRGDQPLQGRISQPFQVENEGDLLAVGPQHLVHVIGLPQHAAVEKAPQDGTQCQVHPCRGDQGQEGHGQQDRGVGQIKERT